MLTPKTALHIVRTSGRRLTLVAGAAAVLGSWSCAGGAQVDVPASAGPEGMTAPGLPNGDGRPTAAGKDDDQDRGLGPPSGLAVLPSEVWRRAAEQRDRLSPAIIDGDVGVISGGEDLVGAPPTGRWEFVGPQGLGVSGRVNGVAFAPSNSAIRYLAAAEGGIWKSVDSGKTWKPKTDSFQWLPATSVAVHPTNPNIVLAGMGDFDYDPGSLRQNAGIVRSTDGGASWTPTDVSGFNAVSAIVFDPDNPNIVLATFGRGLDHNGSVWRSTDGGVSWGLLTDLPSGVWSDLEMGARDSSTGVRYTYVVGHQNGGTIWRSPDRGATWQQLSILRQPYGNETAIEVGASRLHPRTVYALVAPNILPDGTVIYANWNVYVSYDAGSTWTDISNGVNLFSSQSGYNAAIAVGGTTEASSTFARRTPIHRGRNRPAPEPIDRRYRIGPWWTWAIRTATTSRCSQTTRTTSCLPPTVASTISATTPPLL